MSEFKVGITLIDENAHPTVFAGYGYVEPEAAIRIGAAMIIAGRQAARMDGRRIGIFKLWRMARNVAPDGFHPQRQPEEEWKERMSIGLCEGCRQDIRPGQAWGLVDARAFHDACKS